MVTASRHSARDQTVASQASPCCGSLRSGGGKSPGSVLARTSTGPTGRYRRSTISMPHLRTRGVEGCRSPQRLAGSGVRRLVTGQRGSYEDVLHALVEQVEPQPSLVLHIMITSGVVASPTRMSSSKSSSVTPSAGASRTAVGGAIDITLLTARRGCGHLAGALSRVLLSRAWARRS